jgi:hypothetical protein
MQAVRLRELDAGRLIKSARSDSEGRYAFDPVGPGPYVVEMVDDRGAVLASRTARVGRDCLPVSGLVLTSADGAAAAAGTAWFTRTAAVVLYAAAATGATIAIVGTRGDQSPSR